MMLLQTLSGLARYVHGGLEWNDASSVKAYDHIWFNTDSGLFVWPAL